MSEPFIAEVRIFAGNFAPRGWAFCNGQLLPISQNTALFSLIGTTYGGEPAAIAKSQSCVARHTNSGEYEFSQCYDEPGTIDRRPGLSDRYLEQLGKPCSAITPKYWWQPTTQQHATVSDHQFHHCAGGALPVALLIGQIDQCLRRPGRKTS